MRNIYNYIFLILIILSSCKETNSPLCSDNSDESIRITQSEIKSLPNNTLTVINYNKIILYEDKKLIIADISNSSDLQILAEYELTENQYYNSIQLDKFLIIDDESNDHMKEIIDIEKGTMR